MNNDLDIATALAALFEYIREVNILLDADKVAKAEAKQAQTFMTQIDQVLGVMGETARTGIAQTSRKTHRRTGTSTQSA